MGERSKSKKWLEVGVMMAVGKSFVPGLATRTALFLVQLSPASLVYRHVKVISPYTVFKTQVTLGGEGAKVRGHSTNI